MLAKTKDHQNLKLPRCAFCGFIRPSSFSKCSNQQCKIYNDSKAAGLIK